MVWALVVKMLAVTVSMTQCLSMWTAKMTCRETTRLLCEYIDGRLAPGVARAVKQHLDYCHNCQMVLDAARRTLKLYFEESEPVSPGKVKVA